MLLREQQKVSRVDTCLKHYGKAIQDTVKLRKHHSAVAIWIESDDVTDCPYDRNR